MSSRPIALAVVATLVCAGTARADDAVAWHCGDAIPAGHHREIVEDKRTIAAGAMLFALPYLASTFAASDSYAQPADTSPAHGELWIPVVGPFIALDKSAGRDTALVIDGLAQAAGLALVVYAIATPTFVIVPDEHGDRPKLTIAPLLGGGTTGAALVGAF